MRTVATDSRRLAVAQLDVLDKVAERTSFLLPARAAELAVRAFVDTKEMHVGILEQEMVLSDGEITLSGRLVEGNFDSMELSAHSEEYGDAREDMPVTSSDTITLGFSARYLTDALTSMDSEQVRVEMKDPLAAAVFRPVDRSDYTHLIMPMRL